MKRHIMCFGDSNTHGFCADPSDCDDGGARFNESERWTCLLEHLLGDDYKVLEEGLCGRNTVFTDPIFEENLCGIDMLMPLLITHMPIDLLIIMLGTNDSKDMFSADPSLIALGMERLVRKAASIDCWVSGHPKILIVSPPHIKSCLMEHWMGPGMGQGAIERSKGLAEAYRATAEALGCYFFDAGSVASFNDVDGMHLTRESHRKLAQALMEIVNDIFV